MAFPDFPFDKSLPSFLEHSQVLKYLEDYSDHHQLHDNIKVLSYFIPQYLFILLLQRFPCLILVFIKFIHRKIVLCIDICSQMH